MGSVGQGFERLVEIMAKLRDPNGGCPWDLEQTHKSITPYLIEEAYEHLMKAKLHAGRGYSTREEITVWCGGHAVAASRLAREAMNMIEVKKQ